MDCLTLAKPRLPPEQ